MSGVIKFFKSLVSAEPAAASVVAKATELSHPTATATETPSSSPSHLKPSIMQTVKPHVPLIKFRKGGPAPGHSVISGSSAGVAGVRAAAAARGTIEDYQLPLRYQRTPLDVKEIDYINRGGPE